MMTRIPIQGRLLIAFLLVSMIPFAGGGLIAFFHSSAALSRLAFQQLESLLAVRQNQVERFFNQRADDMDVLLETVSSFKQASARKLESVQITQKAHVEGYFANAQSDIRVLSGNPSVLQALESFGSLLNPDGGLDMEMYDFVEEFNLANALHPYRDEYGYADLILVRADGVVVYSLNRAADLGENVLSGDLANTGLRTCFEKGLESASLVDFEPYPPADDAHSAFLGAPVLQFGQAVGVVIFRIDIEPINNMVQQRQGMGETGESFLVGATGEGPELRSDRVVGEGRLGESISGTGITAALSGASGSEIRMAADGAVVVRRYAPMEIPGLNWAIISSVHLEEVISPVLEGESADYFNKFITQYGYDDLLLVHRAGRVFYSVKNRSDYGANLAGGDYGNTVLGRAFKQALNKNALAFADFESYPPAEGQPTAFMARSVSDEEGAELVIVLALSIDPLNALMGQRAGMGETGETYLVGPEGRMRSDGRTETETYSVRASFAGGAEGRVETLAVRAALEGRSGQAEMENYADQKVLSAYAPVAVWGTTWALVAEMTAAEAFQELHDFTRTLLMVGGGLLLALLLVSFWFSRLISRPVKGVISGLRASAQRVGAAALELSSAGQALSQGSSEQAASLEETSSSLEEMASMIQQNADNAAQAERLTQETGRVVSQANRTLEELTGAMAQISKSGQDTSRIVHTIDEIAFQTNLLALNAAVEAARAGQAGAGFAVVAEEVRNLAMRSAEAARNTSELIQKNIAQLEEGAGLVEESNAAFGEVTRSTQRVGELIGEISAASREQADGIEQVNKAVSEMNQVTQQNAATAEEAASASESMRSESGELDGFVRELTVLVEGGRGDSTGEEMGYAPPDDRSSFEESERQWKPDWRGREAGFESATEEEAKNSNDRASGRGRKKKQGREIPPDQLIPFDDEDEFDDF
jgi:methyl-accepting chemotaxis protein